MSEKIIVPSLNRIILAGRVVRNAEKRFTSDNTGVISFRLASSRKYKDKSGEWKETVLFINVSYFEKYSDGLEKKLMQGAPVIVEGSLELNTYEDKKTHEKISRHQIRALKIYVISREISDKTEQFNKYSETSQVIGEVDKDFDNIEENENTGGSDGIPF
ncbi:MAG: hypothetical protein COX48_02845 [bacterium (Candidatus Stahlbacteria) CG23_combo_of_CG06-09_8_20_14_all_34_7]|nr:MAG: hypothetical protein COX48_02845 [bacterium (Candidatus Stahlbacteria) CG23_combo_of_CG06-09_8_20_14_all_34_7]